ncbi:hypothetical protein AAJ76_2370001150 [Vairimorpha ceranae]|uniref:Uncharacterized protein n=1 Tax=Vairimorpha ceranae TaxID=40302 RepID=A0A0F9Z780_9MICR|nr:hypothetical protein AAJ76_2370001150 [Vairimorpha ceranae]KKO73774.1 hypothetical protein AAJ76_2370001150 [Vairimorpha ceranae]
MSFYCKINKNIFDLFFIFDVYFWGLIFFCIPSKKPLIVFFSLAKKCFT